MHHARSMGKWIWDLVSASVYYCQQNRKWCRPGNEAKVHLHVVIHDTDYRQNDWDS